MRGKGTQSSMYSTQPQNRSKILCHRADMRCFWWSRVRKTEIFLKKIKRNNNHYTESTTYKIQELLCVGTCAQQAHHGSLFAVQLIYRQEYRRMHAPAAALHVWWRGQSQNSAWIWHSEWLGTHNLRQLIDVFAPRYWSWTQLACSLFAMEST